MPGRSKTGAPDYDSQDYWEARFARLAAAGDAGSSDGGLEPITAQDGVEWLGSGELLIDAFSSAFDDRLENDDDGGGTPPFYLLHLGSGVSDLSLRIGERLLQHGIPLDRLINADFAHSALAIGRARADRWLTTQDALPPAQMQFCQMDLRSWQSIRAALADAGVDRARRPIGFLFDKSTSDSLATSDDVDAGEADVDEAALFLNLTRAQLLSKLSPSMRTTALDLAALYLAAFVPVGGVWAAISFASDRFDFLHKRHGALSSSLWRLASHVAIPAPSGSQNPFAPPVHHHLFVVRRI